ncbi:hypothetical protein FISHEDRAFT_74688 [Fistulina hepatica ATCC 64428]|uniref:Transmembrane protein n=1 Tax=Fistulina hepatica ATCC 64428 TaxID=1128425 RepID=A0A0D7A9A8_9AGAR|nr:hypothetical protein FISHEDRAFT_74688 [Fistulina hepatica ATCC 64428]
MRDLTLHFLFALVLCAATACGSPCQDAAAVSALTLSGDRFEGIGVWDSRHEAFGNAPFHASHRHLSSHGKQREQRDLLHNFPPLWKAVGESSAGHSTAPSSTMATSTGASSVSSETSFTLSEPTALKSDPLPLVHSVAPDDSVQPHHDTSTAKVVIVCAIIGVLVAVATTAYLCIRFWPRRLKPSPRTVTTIKPSNSARIEAKAPADFGHVVTPFVTAPWTPSKPAPAQASQVSLQTSQISFGGTTLNGDDERLVTLPPPQTPVITPVGTQPGRLASWRASTSWRMSSTPSMPSWLRSIPLPTTPLGASLRSPIITSFRTTRTRLSSSLPPPPTAAEVPENSDKDWSVLVISNDSPGSRFSVTESDILQSTPCPWASPDSLKNEFPDVLRSMDTRELLEDDEDMTDGQFSVISLDPPPNIPFDPSPAMVSTPIRRQRPARYSLSTRLSSVISEQFSSLLERFSGSVGTAAQLSTMATCGCELGPCPSSLDGDTSSDDSERSSMKSFFTGMAQVEGPVQIPFIFHLDQRLRDEAVPISRGDKSWRRERRYSAPLKVLLSARVLEDGRATTPPPRVGWRKSMGF